MREYLGIMMPLLRDGEVDFRGELWQVLTARFFQTPDRRPVEVLVAALGPQAVAVCSGQIGPGHRIEHGWRPKTSKTRPYCAHH